MQYSFYKVDAISEEASDSFISELSHRSIKMEISTQMNQVFEEYARKLLRIELECERLQAEKKEVLVALSRETLSSAAPLQPPLVPEPKPLDAALGTSCYWKF